MMQNAIESLESRTLFAAVSKFSDFGTAGLAPLELTPLGSKMIFTGNTAAEGRELWISDGTAAGTKLVKDLVPGPLSSGIVRFFRMGNNLYFYARSESDRALWRTDGTTAGTVRLKSWQSYEQPQFEIFQNRLYFTDRASLWRTDGTVGGTSLVKNFGSVPGNPFSGPELMSMRATGKSLYILSYAGDLKFALWRTYGTESSTVKIATIYNDSDGRNLESIGNDLYFTGSHEYGQTSYLWKVSDNNTMTPISPVHDASLFIYDGKTAYFLAAEEELGWGLYRLSNGATTRLASTSWNNNTIFKLVNRKLFFETSYSDHILIYDLDTGSLNDINELTGLDGKSLLGPAVGGRVYFATHATFNDRDKTVWSTDGTIAGSAILQSYNTDTIYDVARLSQREKVVNIDVVQFSSKIYFPGKDKTYRSELASSNINGKSGKLVYDQTGRNGAFNILKTATFGASIYALVEQEDFSLPNGTHSILLWKTDGNSIPTLVGELGIGASSRTRILQIGSRIVIVEDYGNTKYETIDAAGLHPWDNSYSVFMGVVNNRLLVAGYRYTEPSKIYFSNGSPDLSVSRELPEGWRADSAIQLINGMGYFLVKNDNTGQSDIWQTDGTAVGTNSLGLTGLFGASVANSDIQYILAEYNGSLAMVERSSSNASTSVDKLYLINARKKKFISSTIGSGDRFHDEPVILGSTSKGLVIDLGSVGGLVVSDATSAGTSKILSRSQYTGRYSYLITFNGKIYFKDDQHVYFTDGTAAGTHVISGIKSDVEGMTNSHAVIKDSKLYFLNPTDQVIYQIDGSKSIKIAGVQVIGKTYHGQIDDAVVLNGKIFFNAIDPSWNENLYVVTDTTPPEHSIFGTIFNDANRNGKQDAGESGVPGLRVFIDANLNGRYDRGDTQSISDATGFYAFDHLSEGIFNLRATITPPWNPSTPKSVKLAFNGTYFSQHFGVYK